MDNQHPGSLISGPLSSSMIYEISTAHDVAKELYPSWGDLKKTEKAHDRLLSENPGWTRYRQKLAAIEGPDGLTVSFSLRELAVAEEVDSEDFETYLNLLRGAPKDKSITITEVTKRIDYETFLSTLDRRKSWIIPVQDDDSWSFSVIRPHNKDWYGGGLISAPASISRPPSPQTLHGNRSAACVLLGIRLLSQGLPQADFKDIKTLGERLTHWCTRVLVELSCRRLDPDDGSVSEQYHIVEHYCNMEQTGDGQLVDYCRDVAGFTSESLPTNMHISPSPAQGSLPAGTNTSPSCASESPLSNTSISPALSGESPSSSPLPSMAATQDEIDMRNILAILSTAALAARMVGPSPESYEVLLDILSKKEKIDPCFHFRKCKQKLYSKLIEEGLPEDGSGEDSPTGYHVGRVNRESLRRESRQWERIRDWCHRNSVSEFSILCAIPKREAWDCAGLENVYGRLTDDNDKLGDLLRKTGELCDAIIACELPPNLLPVEVFRGKENNAFDEAQFTAFVDLHGAKIETPPRPLQSRKRVTNGAINRRTRQRV